MSRTFEPDRFRRVDSIFDAVLDLPEPERGGFLDRACAGDDELRADVVALLASADTAESILGENVAEFAAPLIMGWSDDQDAALADGAMLGPWRVVREIGRGGMGAVYLAERADRAFALRVAIKVVKRGMDTGEVLRRFHEERRILATLDHPNIARLIDAGSTPDGRPYLVMEYVDGRSIDVWCDAARLDLRRRAALFRDVCEAVHQAHGRLIVHRDVKPSNVLVTDGTAGAGGKRGVPKLLDFGIAKLLDRDESRTLTGLRPHTPEYAAPEQLSGEPVTTATDVYALGRLLYELLSGIRPPRQDGSRDGLVPSAAVRERYLAQDPERRAGIAAIAAARGTTPERLATALQGDLDTIALHAMAAEPARRYASAMQLSEDLDRWLRGLPVLARPDSVGYRAAKFVGRNRAAVATAGGFVILLIAFAVSMAAAQRRTADALARAENERDTAEQVSAVLETIFSAGDPTAARPERLDTFRVAALLDRSAARVREDLGDRPSVQARLLRALGDAYRGLGLYDAADTLLRAAVHAHDRLPDSVALGTALNSLGLLELQRGRSAQAEPWFRRTLAVRREALPAGHPDVVRTLSNLAATRQDQADFSEAAALYDEAMQLIDGAQAPDSALLSIALNGRAMLAQRSGDFATAASTAERILAIDRARLGGEHPRVAIGLVNLGLMHERLGRSGSADSLLSDGVAMFRSTLGSSHPAYFIALSSLANQRSLRGMHADAKPMFEEAIAGMRRTVGSTPDLSTTLSHQADMFAADGDVAAAESAAEEALEIQRAGTGAEHPSTAVLTAQLARFHCAREAFDRAGTRYREALAVLETVFPATHPRVIDVRGTFASCLTRAGRFEEAEAILIASYEALGGGAKTDTVPPPVREIATRLAELYDAWNRPHDALKYRQAGS